MSLKIKEKPCKGTGKAKGYGCGKMVLARTYGLGMSCCYGNWLYTSEEGQKKLNAVTNKVTEPRRSLEKAIETDKKTKGIATALKTTKTVVHKMVRLRDKGKPCISCGCQWNDGFEAGHCYPTKFRSIRFWFYNINGQCFKCNNFEDGNQDNYLLNLPERIGQERFDELQRLAKEDRKFNKHWTKDELSEIRKEAKKKIKNLK